MANILCVYYSRTGRTEKLMQRMANELGCEIVRLEDGVKRGGPIGWMASGLHAVSRKVPPVSRPETKKKLKDYDLVIVATPVWAGRCSAPVRSFLMQFGNELKRVAYVITRSCSLRYDEVFEQMDQYVRRPHVHAFSIQADTIGADFWCDELVKTVGGEKKGETDHAEQAQSGR